MPSIANYKIQAMWQPRIEDPEQIAVRLRRLISMLQTVHPLTRKWYHVNFEGACYDIDTLGDRLVNTIVGRVSKGDFGEPEPEWGYHLIAYNRPDVAKLPEGLWLDGQGGGYVSSSLSIATNYDLAPIRVSSATMSSKPCFSRWPRLSSLIGSARAQAISPNSSTCSNIRGRRCSSHG